ncbi:hypothetical protein [Tuwongella immobilis]|nr:hypothetical protein [Tuwongella immobilis]
MRWILPSLAATLLATSGAIIAAESPAESTKPARCVSKSGTMIAQERTDRPWRSIEQGKEVPEKESIVALPEASLDSGDGAIRVTALADYEGKSPYPILETAFTLYTPTGESIDLELDRGRIDLLNIRKNGPATAEIRFADEEWRVTLEEPNSQVSIERFGRWQSGARFAIKPTATDQPDVFVILIVRSGAISLETKRHRYRMTAPPGPALLQWDSVSKMDAFPQRLDKLPEWAISDEKPSATTLTYRKALEQFRQIRLEKGISEAVDAFYTSGDPIRERIALVSMGAMDDLPRIGAALSESRSAGIWDFGVVVARHWIGRGPGADQELYQFLLNNRGFSVAHARTLMELLHGFSETTIHEPGCYELLIELLKHERPAIRNLAGWHLHRLVPDLREKIPFKPNASPEESRRTYEAWKAAIPAGSVPPNVQSPREPAKGDRP